MSVSFGGYADGGPNGVSGIDLDYESPLFLNLSASNATALLSLLRLPSPDPWGPCGSCTLPEARRAVMYARGTFGTRAGRYTRQATERQGQLGAKFVEMGLDEDGLQLRLERFARLVEHLAEKGATHVCWG